MQSAQRLAAIRARLTAALAPHHLEVSDDSERHRGHPGARSGAGHFNVLISSEKFAGLSEIACHRLIYAAIGDLMEKEIHALSITVI